MYVLHSFGTQFLLNKNMYRKTIKESVTSLNMSLCIKGNLREKPEHFPNKSIKFICIWYENINIVPKFEVYQSLFYTKIMFYKSIY